MSNKKKDAKVASLNKKKSRKYFYSFIKRLFDILVSLIGIVFLVPITIILKISFMLTGDFHSIFYSHNRVGKNGEVFKMYKFRSMVPNADEELKKLLKQKKYKKEWEANQKLDNDPRITKIGKFIRKTSIDETPQFINMFLGDISLIGPRPLVPGELDAHNGIHEIYESVKPGITGWWAVNGRSATDYEKRLELEYYYVEHRGFKIDFLCIFKTIKVIFTKAGAK
ncbi:MAG: sugar transferase [Bacilli bacterium]|nr:sugar transferase [Bacilli bacterium]